MAMHRNIILIGLGEFGKNVNENIKSLIEKRKTQLGDVIDEVSLFYINFKNDDVFYSSLVQRAILESVKNSRGKRQGESFSYYFTGNLYENGTSRFAIDFACIPHILNTDKVLKLDKVNGFFTFADELGVSQKADDESMALINIFFDNLQKINEENKYVAPFSTVDGKKIQDVTLPTGPFERNYVIVTPGQNEDVVLQTGIIFAEKIFYELFYLSSKYSEVVKNLHSKTTEKFSNEKNLSTFSMVHVPRLAEIQKYFLNYNLENIIYKNLLDDIVVGNDIPYYFKKFLKSIDIDSENQKFPLERAAQLFIEKYKSNFTHILPNYFYKGKVDKNDYVEICKNLIQEKVDNLFHYCDDFAIEEIENLLKTLELGFVNLLKVERLSGNLNTYIDFVTKLKNIFENWTLDLKSEAENEDIYDIEDDYKKIDEKIKKYQNSKLFSFPLLRPIRQFIIKQLVLCIPFEKYLARIVRKNVASSFLIHWEDSINDKINPINSCDSFIKNLLELKLKIENKNNYIENKIEYIKNLNSFYYVIEMFKENEEYLKLLERIKEKNFGATKKANVNKITVNAFKKWTSEKDFISIIQNPTAFTDFIENEYSPTVFYLFNEIEIDNDRFEKYAKNAVENVKERSHNLNSKSYNIENSSSYFEKKEILLEPKFESKDIITRELESYYGDLDNFFVPKEFSLGSAILFCDYLYMSKKNLQKNNSLKNYANIEVSKNKYDFSLNDNKTIVYESPKENQEDKNTKKIDNQFEKNLSNMKNYHEEKNENKVDSWKVVKSFLKFYLAENEKKKFIEDEKIILAEDLSNLDEVSKSVELKKLLKYVSDEKLEEFAKDQKINVSSSREKQEELILKHFE